MSSNNLRSSITAAKYRDDGWTVAFWGGRVYLWKPGHPVVGQPIDQGKWMDRPNGWEGEGIAVEKRMQTIRANCYCGSGGVRACDFCQGARSV